MWNLRQGFRRRRGSPLEVCAFLGSSPIRFYAEGWKLERMLHTAEESVSFCVREGLPVMFVTEDTTRATGETLKVLYGHAIEWGARRICPLRYGRPPRRHPGSGP